MSKKTKKTRSKEPAQPEWRLDRLQLIKSLVEQRNAEADKPSDSENEES